MHIKCTSTKASHRRAEPHSPTVSISHRRRRALPACRTPLKSIKILNPILVSVGGGANWGHLENRTRSLTVPVHYVHAVALANVHHENAVFCLASSDPPTRDYPGTRPGFSKKCGPPGRNLTIFSPIGYWVAIQKCTAVRKCEFRVDIRWSESSSGRTRSR